MEGRNPWTIYLVTRNDRPDTQPYNPPSDLFFDVYLIDQIRNTNGLHILAPCSVQVLSISTSPIISIDTDSIDASIQTLSSTDPHHLSSLLERRVEPALVLSITHTDRREKLL